MEEKNIIRNKKNGLVYGKSKSLVIVISAVMIASGIWVFAPQTAKAAAAVFILHEARPNPVSESALINLWSNWTHPDAMPHVLQSSGNIYFTPDSLAPPCSTSATPAMVNNPLIPTLWSLYMLNSPINSVVFPDYTGPGFYYFSSDVTSVGDPPSGDPTTKCTPSTLTVEVTGLDGTPPDVAGHGITPPPGSVPQFSAPTVPPDSFTILQYTVSDETAGGSFITDAEHFVCGPVALIDPPCGPDPLWVNDTGIKPDEPLPNNPWIPPFPPQQWNQRTRMYLETNISTVGWAEGAYWFYIHGADCGENGVCDDGQGDDNWGKDVGSVGDTWYELKLVVSSAPNNPPVLSWTGEPGYTVDGVEPNSGDPTTLFEFRVNYTDADNNAPSYMDLWLHKPCGADFSGPHAMTAVVPGDIDYTDGKLYNYSTTFAATGTYGHRFEASDGTDTATGGLPIGCTDGPIVTTAGNNPPVLSWTNIPGPFFTDGLDPETGDTTTLFEYRVNYTDVDDDAPTFMDLYIEKPCTTPFSGPHGMKEMDPLDVDYTDGKLYNYSTTFATTGLYGYYFAANDGTDPATGLPTSCTPGPTVTAVGALSAPPNLWVERSNPDIIVHWDAVAGADSYNVSYVSNDRFLPFSSWNKATGLTATQWTHPGAYNNGTTHYYIVRAFNATGGESMNSTMGVKLHKLMEMPSGIPGRNVYWISLPYNSMYKKASDIVMDLEGSLTAPPTNINGVCKWNPATQNAMLFLFFGRWRGADFTINPGDGICVNSINDPWNWIINGTDTSVLQSFTFNPTMNNINWMSLPYTNNYTTASEIIRDIEGSLVNPPTMVTAIAIWDPIAQDVIKYEWTGSWTGTNFPIRPGDGYYLDILSGFTWTPTLITPSVP
jgi:hypothetical protein